MKVSAESKEGKRCKDAREARIQSGSRILPSRPNVYTVDMTVMSDRDHRYAYGRHAVLSTVYCVLAVLLVLSGLWRVLWCAQYGKYARRTPRGV